MNQQAINYVIETWINGNLSHAIEKFLELNTLEQSYCIYYMDSDEVTPRFLRLLESKLYQQEN